MSHPEQQLFFDFLVGKWKAVANHKEHRIIEIGSFDVNGTVRQKFGEAKSFLGVDLVEGPGVDLVCRGHEVKEDIGPFDISIATEVFEHDFYWKLTLRKLTRLTRPGGLVVVTCGSKGRPEHGTRRTNALLSPGTQAIGDDYYRNLDKSDFEIEVKSLGFTHYQLLFLPWPADLYFIGVSPPQGKSGVDNKLQGISLTDQEIRKISALMPLSHKIVRIPLRAIAFAFGQSKGATYLAYLYWKTCSSLVSAVGLDKRIRRSIPSET